MQQIINGTTNKHIIMFVPSVKACGYAYKALNTIIKNTSHPYLNNYKVLSVSSYEENEDAYKNMEMETKINKFEEDNEYTIVLTCQKLTTGVTMKRSDCILMMRSISSAETFIQILFRIMTPFAGKLCATMYNFDSEACYQVIKEHTSIKQTEDSSKTQMEYIEELTNLINFEYCLSNDAFDFISETSEDFLKNIKELPVSYSFTKVFSDTKIDLSKEEIIELCAHKFEEAGVNKYIVAEGKGGNVKSSVSKRKGITISDENTGNGKIKDKKSDIIKQLEAMMRNIDWIIVLNKVKFFDELLNINPFENI